ncbi:MAG: magnesium transporter [Mariniblastus sp.]|jgi:magnesium transporter
MFDSPSISTLDPSTGPTPLTCFATPTRPDTGLRHSSTAMLNTLFLPELREMLEADNAEGLRDFCQAIHPTRAAEFMAGLSSEDAWQVLQHSDVELCVDIFTYFEKDKQLEILETQPLNQVAEMVAELPPDDRVDLLRELEANRLAMLLERLPLEERRDFQRLSQYPEGTAGAVMTTEIAKLSESLSIRDALDEIGRQSEEYETIYYLYIVDDEDHLRGLVSARQLLTGMKNPETRLFDIMETDLVTVDALEDQEDVANKVARMDLLAIPVVDDQHKMLGIITHDDVIDVVQEEATEDAHRIGAVDPLDESYLRTSLITLTWKRGIWLAILFFFALLTAIAIQEFETDIKKWVWLALFIPLVISSGGNSGSQSATLIITALSRGHITLHDWLRVVLRELAMGMLLGAGLAAMGFVAGLFFVPDEFPFQAFFIVPVTLVLVVICGTLTGAIFPLLFEKLGWDPAMMSTPFVAGIVDILGILIYFNVANAILG